MKWVAIGGVRIFHRKCYSSHLTQRISNTGSLARVHGRRPSTDCGGKTDEVMEGIGDLHRGRVVRDTSASLPITWHAAGCELRSVWYLGGEEIPRCFTRPMGGRVERVN